MLFDLSNAPVNFQGYVNRILAEMLDIFTIVYLDILVCTLYQKHRPRSRQSLEVYFLGYMSHDG